MVPPSGTSVPVAAEKEKFAGEPADGSCVEKDHVPRVLSKPAFVKMPLPVTVTEAGEPPWEKTDDEVRLNTYPPTDQNEAIGPDAKLQGAENATDVKGATAPADKVELITNGRPTPPGPVHAVTAVAVPAEGVFMLTPPANVMLPEIGTACTLAAKLIIAATVAARIVIWFFIVLVFCNGFLLKFCTATLS